LEGIHPLARPAPPACKGDEIVQVYVRDCVSSVARPVRQLAGFARVSLMPKETKQVTFEITGKKMLVERKVFASAVTIS